MQSESEKAENKDPDLTIFGTDVSSSASASGTTKPAASSANLKNAQTKPKPPAKTPSAATSPPMPKRKRLNPTGKSS
jgi:hypothetical protein